MTNPKVWRKNGSEALQLVASAVLVSVKAAELEVLFHPFLHLDNFRHTVPLTSRADLEKNSMVADYATY